MVSLGIVKVCPVVSDTKGIGVGIRYQPEWSSIPTGIFGIRYQLFMVSGAMPFPPGVPRGCVTFRTMVVASRAVDYMIKCTQTFTAELQHSGVLPVAKGLPFAPKC